MTKSELYLTSFSDGSSFLVKNIQYSEDSIRAEIIRDLEVGLDENILAESLEFNQNTGTLRVIKYTGDSYSIDDCRLLGITTVGANPFR
jgi:hypothetical protein